MDRFCELKLLEKAGHIENLALQIPFDLMVNEKLICKYVCDFAYFENGKPVVEDFKGMETGEFRIKWKLAQALYPQFTWRKSFRGGFKDSVCSK